jgi:aminoglycoside phosphotransferase (APT) family kinase protein
MHADEIHIDSNIARELIADQFPARRHEQVVRLEGAGTVHAIFRIGSGLVARFGLRQSDPDECAERLKAEAAAMTEFARHCPFATPRPIAIGAPGKVYPMPWMIQSWIDGAVAAPDGSAASEALARDVICLISALRAAPTQGRRFRGPGRGGHLPDHDDWMSQCFDRSDGLLDVPKLRRLWASMRELGPAGPDVMSHTDLIPANLVLRDGRLAGVLDAGGFGAADPALDLIVAWHLFDHGPRNLIRARLGCSDVEWKRGAAWAFQQAMGLVWYYRDTNPAMSELGRSTLARLMVDPDLHSLSA